ncbi:MAG: RNA polymerase-binding transcription factor DksA [Paraglaciecola sp.]
MNTPTVKGFLKKSYQKNISPRIPRIKMSGYSITAKYFQKNKKLDVMATVSSRYSEANLAEFKTIVAALIEKGMAKLERLENDYKEAAETMESESDWMDDSSSQNDLGMLQMLVSRQRKHVNDLQNALQRIHNKSYGICIVTGELIDKRRLIAVPTTSKSIAGKNIQAAPPKKTDEIEEDEDVPKPKPKVKEKGAPVIISRVIKKSTAAPIIEEEEEEDDEDEDDDLDDLYEENAEEEFDFDSIADEGSRDN